MNKRNYYLVNGITLYRLISAPFLFYLVIIERIDIFKWLLAFSFFTDAIDGYLARKYKVVSKLGAKLDSIADDLTVLVGTVALLITETDFVRQYGIWIIVLLVLFLIQAALAFRKFKRFTSFHTISAKLAAIFQGIFLILSFFLPEPSLVLYFAAVIVTGIDLIEEIIMVFFINEYKTDVKGLYWLLRDRKR